MGSWSGFKLLVGKRSHDRLLHMQAILGFLNGDAGGGVHHAVAGLDVPA
jgi:hypothetical protein